MINPELQINDKLEFELKTEYNLGIRHPCYVTIQNDDIIFGRRNRKTVTNSVSAAYTFTDLMSLDFRLRHY